MPRQSRPAAKGQLQDPGSPAQNFLTFIGAAVDGDVYEIGGTIFEMERLDTDTTDDTANGDFNNTTNPLTLVGGVAAYPNAPFTVGRLIRVQNEIMRVTAVAGGDVTLARGVSGTTNAVHANAQSIFRGNGIAGGSDVAVGMVIPHTGTSLATALGAEMEAADLGFDAHVGTGFLAIASSLPGPALNGVSCTTTNSAGNSWVAPVTFGGVAPARKMFAIQGRVVASVEDTLQTMAFVFPAAHKIVTVSVNGKFSDATVTYSTPANLAFLDFAGTVAIVAGDLVTVTAVAE